MTKIDMITGFLGSGKTTFLIKYVDYLLSIGQRVCVLEFDYGAINIDMMLLQKFNNKCDLEMVAGGCDYDCHLRRFKTKLIAMGMRKYDRVIIEPSGIFDPDELFEVLYEEPICNWYEMGSIISIVDPSIRKIESLDSKYILTSQLAASGLTIISKTQNYKKEDVENTITYLENVLNESKIPFNKDNVITKSYDKMGKNDFDNYMKAGYHEYSFEKRNVMSQNSYSTIYFLDKKFTIEKLKKIVNQLFVNDGYGNIIRIKGFIFDQSWYEFNATKEEVGIESIQEGQDVIIIIGEKLNEKNIQLLIE